MRVVKQSPAQLMQPPPSLSTLPRCPETAHAQAAPRWLPETCPSPGATPSPYCCSHAFTFPFPELASATTWSRQLWSSWFCGPWDPHHAGADFPRSPFTKASSLPPCFPLPPLPVTHRVAFVKRVYGCREYKAGAWAGS